MKFCKASFVKVIICLILPVYLWAVPGRPSTPLERAWLELLSRPMTGTTVCYLPTSLRFGITNLPFDYAVALKSGVSCHILLDGTERVYRLEKDDSGPYLNRIDSTKQLGGNYRMMPFLRNDTLFRFGGYGFWRTRDYFTWFDPSTGQWRRWADAASLPSAFSYYWYNINEDAFYLFGTWENRPHENFRDISRDSLFRYDFQTRRWKSMGWIDKSTHDGNMVINILRSYVTTSPFGLVTVGGPFATWIDFPTHSMISIRMQHMRQIDSLQDIHKHADPSFKNEYYLTMGDSLYTVVEYPDRSTAIHTLPLRKEMFDSSTLRSFIVVPDEHVEGVFQNRFTTWTVVILLAAIASFLSFILFRDPFRGQAVQILSGFIRSRTSKKLDRDIKSSGSEFEMGHFLACLRPSDRRLLEFLLRKAESGTSSRVEDINHHMGIGSKPEELQKVSRNKAIQNINEAFHSTLQTDEELIVRIRDSDDRRVMMYQIHPHYVTTLIKLIDA